MKWNELPALLKQTYAEWNEDKAPRLGAALSYYTVFSMAPFLVVVLSIAGIMLDRVGFDVKADVLKQISTTFGSESGVLIGKMLDNANHKGSGFVAAAIGLGTLLLGAGGLFGQLQDALNTIWGVAPRPDLGFMGMLRARFLSFTMVLGTGFLLLVSLVLSAGLAKLGEWMGSALPLPEWTITLLNFVVSFGIITVLFAMIFKVLPDAEIQWHDVWIGAAVTSLLFNIGKLGLAVYLARSAPDSTYGEAGALVLILLWVYYAAQILFFGAEFTQVYASRFGSRIAPSPNAVAVTPEALARQGAPRSEQMDNVMAKASSRSTTSEAGALGAPAAPAPQLTPAPPWTDGFDAAAEAKLEAEQNKSFMTAALAGFAVFLLAARWRDARREKRAQRLLEREEVRVERVRRPG